MAAVTHAPAIAPAGEDAGWTLPAESSQPLAPMAPPAEPPTAEPPPAEPPAPEQLWRNSHHASHMRPSRSLVTRSHMVTA